MPEALLEMPSVAVAVINPKAPASELAIVQSQVIGPLEDARDAGLIKHVQVVETVSSEPSLNAEAVVDRTYKLARDGDDAWYFMCRGDSMAPVLASVLQEHGSGSGVLLPYGSYNNAARMITGKQTHRMLKKYGVMRVIEASREVDFYTMEATTRDEQLCRAMGYIGFGLTAKIANQVNDPDHRKWRGESELRKLAVDGFTVLSTAIRNRRFKYALGDEGNRRNHEVLMANISEMAAKLPIDAEDFARELTLIELGGTNAMLSFIGRAVTGIRPSGMAFRGESRQLIRLAIDQDEPIPMQYDGEVKLIKPKQAGIITVTHDNTPVKMRTLTHASR